MIQFKQYQYDPYDHIGKGGFAEVFKATDNNTNQIVALKICEKPVTKGSSGRDTKDKKYSLEAEFKLARELSHTNIITYYGLDYLEGTDHLGRTLSYPVLIIEYATEGSLLDFMKNNLDKATKHKLIKDIIEGLAYLHEQDIIHRDLKPGNILITKDRRGNLVAKITDFGISRDTLTNKTIEESYTEGIGTPHYMAPEQFLKKKFGFNQELSNRTDLWSIGVIMHSMFTGKLPFAGDSKDYGIIQEAITEKPFTAQGYSSGDANISHVVKKCLSKDASGRYANAHKLLADLLPKSREEIDWDSISHRKETIVFTNFLRNYPNGKFQDRALSKIEEISKNKYRLTERKKITASPTMAWERAIAYEDAENKLIRTFKGHGNDVNSVSLSADGKLGLSGSL